MFERERTLYEFLSGYTKMLLADVSDEQMTAQPTPDANHPAWHIGHLALIGDFAAQMLGLERECPRKWFVLFGRGSKPSGEPEKYPGKQELLDMLESNHRRVSEAVQTVSAEKLNEPNPVEDLRGPLPTLGDAIAHMMTTHEAMHLGQIAAWRNAMNLPNVF